MFELQVVHRCLHDQGLLLFLFRIDITLPCSYCDVSLIFVPVSCMLQSPWFDGDSVTDKGVSLTFLFKKSVTKRSFYGQLASSFTLPP
jgi:hypothetical protein